MGVDRAVRIEIQGQDGGGVVDPLTVARALAESIRRQEPNLVLAGVQSSDAVQAATGSMLAELLGHPVGEPAAHSAFARMGRLYANVIPLVLVCLGLVVHALREQLMVSLEAASARGEALSRSSTAGGEVRLGTVSMNSPESDHIAADLGIPTWTQNISLLSANRRKRLTLQVGQSENFGLGQNQTAADTRRAGKFF